MFLKKTKCNKCTRKCKNVLKNLILFCYEIIIIQIYFIQKEYLCLSIKRFLCITILIKCTLKICKILSFYYK